MSIDNHSKISYYINKFKGTNNLYKSFNEFDLELTDNIKRMFEMISLFL